MIRRLLTAICLLFLLVCPARAWDGTIHRVLDGDTVIVIRAETSEKIRVRLYGIDAPEGKGRGWEPQPYSRKATDYLKTLLPVNSRVAVMDMGYDKYSRTVGGIVTLPDGTVIQEDLLKEGLAWIYPKYCTDCSQWKDLERQARERKMGLWGGNNPAPPWEWRHKTKPKP